MEVKKVTCQICHNDYPPLLKNVAPNTDGEAVVLAVKGHQVMKCQYCGYLVCTGCQGFALVPKCKKCGKEYGPCYYDW